MKRTIEQIAFDVLSKAGLGLGNSAVATLAVKIHNAIESESIAPSNIIDDTFTKIVLFDPIRKDYFRYAENGGPTSDPVHADKTTIEPRLHQMHLGALKQYSCTHRFLPFRLIIETKPFSDSGQNVLAEAKRQARRAAFKRIPEDDRELLGINLHDN